jgi:hypothetical protein
MGDAGYRRFAEQLRRAQNEAKRKNQTGAQGFSKSDDRPHTSFFHKAFMRLMRLCRWILKSLSP